jgi:DNA-binding NtrC family response regulator
MDRGKKILIVEPDAKMSEKLRQVLRKEHFSVSITDRASEAIRALQKEHVSVLILDVGVKDMAWDEMFAIVKGIDSGLPIIMTSDHNTPELEVSILRQRAFYYHVKSFGTEDLVLAVRSAIEKPLTHG